MRIKDAIAGVAGRVLLGDSVFEDALLTVREGVLYIDFEGDIDNVAVDLRPLAESPSEGASTP